MVISPGGSESVGRSLERIVEEALLDHGSKLRFWHGSGHVDEENELTWGSVHSMGPNSAINDRLRSDQHQIA